MDAGWCHWIREWKWGVSVFHCAPNGNIPQSPSSFASVIYGLLLDAVLGCCHLFLSLSPGSQSGRSSVGRTIERCYRCIWRSPQYWYFFGHPGFRMIWMALIDNVCLESLSIDLTRPMLDSATRSIGRLGEKIQEWVDLLHCIGILIVLKNQDNGCCKASRWICQACRRPAGCCGAEG